MATWPDLTLEEKMTVARRDDIFEHLVPSDIRVLLGEIKRLREELANSRPRSTEDENV